MFRFIYYMYFMAFRSQTADQLYSRIIIRIANILLPLYFHLTFGFHRNKIPESDPGREIRYIVSMTTFPLRIDKVWLVLETMLHQKKKPDSIILWLYKDEFDGKRSLPRSLLKLEKRGLQIRFGSENLMPHLKYFYTMLEYPDANIITIDDDILYPPDLIEKLIQCHKTYPSSIICPVTRKIKKIGTVLQPYSSWDYLRVSSEPSFQNLTMGVGSAFYPIKSLHPDVFNLEFLKKLALRTDDLWIKIMSIKNGTGVVSMAGEYSRFFIPVIHNSHIQLMDFNIGQGLNDNIFSGLINFWNIPVSAFNDHG